MWDHQSLDFALVIKALLVKEGVDVLKERLGHRDPLLHLRDDLALVRRIRNTRQAFM